MKNIAPRTSSDHRKVVFVAAVRCRLARLPADPADEHRGTAGDVAGLVLHDLEEIAVEDDSLGDVGADREALGSLFEHADVGKLAWLPA